MRLFFASVAVAALLTGCSSTDTQHAQESAKSFEQKASVEGKKLESSAKVEGKKLETSAAEGVNSTKVKAALMASSKLNTSHLNVDTEGKTIYLRGSVPTAEEKTLAARIAGDTADKDQKVVDQLKVEAVASSTPAEKK
jgi:osmotically-inducible protein OsmY